MFYMFVIGSYIGNLKIDQLCVFWTQVLNTCSLPPAPLHHM